MPDVIIVSSDNEAGTPQKTFESAVKQELSSSDADVSGQKAQYESRYIPGGISEFF